MPESDNNSNSNSHLKRSEKGIPWALSIGALGIVFGDIGTSPLYAMRECFGGAHGAALTNNNILGILSLIFWALIIVVSIKYLMLVLRADNRGEGGNLALMALAQPHKEPSNSSRRKLILFLGLFGASLLYGDGVITPAISVLSAIEGLKVATPLFEPYILSITLIVIFTLFMFQSVGTQKIGAVFGPIIMAWFTTIGVLGAFQAVKNPEVFQAMNPYYAINFFIENGWSGFRALSGVFLVVTGGEALYADMGHFGRRPIRLAWFSIVLPGLMLNYLGQGALLLSDNSAISNPFYKLAPSWGIIPLVILATFATVIASQAVISGAFSITRQAVQLGYLPRIEVIHTSKREIGQIYVRAVNWILLILTLWLVVEFKSSSALASAYGIAVSGTMIMTTILVSLVSRKIWGWSLWKTIAIAFIFLASDFVFFSANIIKIADGGWVPLTIGIAAFTIMTTWQRGRDILSSRLSEGLIPLDHFIMGIIENPPIRTPGTSIFMCRNNCKVPPALMHNIKHNKVLHEKIILLMVTIEEIPHVTPSNRYKIKHLQAGFSQITASYGFMDQPDIPRFLNSLPESERISNLANITFFLGRETLFATKRPGMAIWRERLFAFLSRNAQPATNYYRVPTERVVEIGMQVEL